MRIERWFWLPIFCVVSALLHVTLAVATRGAGGGLPHAVPETGTIEVAFERPAPLPKPKPEPKPAPVKPKPQPSVAHGPRPALLAPYRVAAIRPTPTVRGLPKAEPVRIARAEPTPIAPRPKVKESAELPEKIAAETPEAAHRAEAPRTPPSAVHISRNPVLAEGGGSPSPSPIPGGHGGLNAPETPKEDVLYTGGGPGNKVPAIEPKIGGGGGKSILSVNTANPLGNGIPEDKPGIGPGSHGGIGSGSGGGIGSATGKGIGTRADGRVAIGSLRRRPGAGIGAAVAGSEVGTRAPGGGKGRGAELPGTGGTGNGYGRGHANSIGDGGDDAAPPTRMRGVPFGNVAGLLGGGDAGGPRGGGGPGRGAVFGARPAGGGQGTVHIVYALDVSGSMRDGNKIGKAKEALKKALGELKRTDTFNIIIFKRDASTFRDDSVPATLVNVTNAKAFVDGIQIGDGTNISRAMELALGMNGITHIYLMSDGEPNGGIGDFNELRRYIRENNIHSVKIMTLALGLGENFPGMRLLKGIADDNNGSYDYINLSRITGN